MDERQELKRKIEIETKKFEDAGTIAMEDDNGQSVQVAFELDC